MTDFLTYPKHQMTTDVLIFPSLKIFSYLTYPAAAMSGITAIISPYLGLDWGEGITVALMFAPILASLVGVLIGVRAQRRSQGGLSNPRVLRLILPCLLVIGFTLLGCCAAAALLAPRMQLLAHGRRSSSEAVTKAQVVVLLHAAELYATNEGNWPPTLATLFQSHQLHVHDLSVGQAAEIDRLLSLSAKPVDFDSQIEAAIGVKYFGENVTTQSDSRIIIMESNPPSVAGNVIVGFANGAVKVLDERSIAQARLDNQKARNEDKKKSD